MHSYLAPLTTEISVWIYWYENLIRFCNWPNDWIVLCFSSRLTNDWHIAGSTNKKFTFIYERKFKKTTGLSAGPCLS